MTELINFMTVDLSGFYLDITKDIPDIPDIPISHCVPEATAGKIASKFKNDYGEYLKYIASIGEK